MNNGAGAKRLGAQTVKFENRVPIISTATIAGPKETEGPLSDYFDVKLDDDMWDEDSWEKAESKMQREAVKIAVSRRGLALDDIDYIFAGDLLNQCTAAGFGIRDLNIPYFGVYGACSTMIEGLSLGAMMIDGGYATTAAAVSSSHYCTAERQYRNPLEYGGQRTPTAQWTVTGAAAAVLGYAEGSGTGDVQKEVYITHATTGRIVDFGVKDPNNMGGAMAPAAVSTLAEHFKATGTQPKDYDLILTGDLGTLGKSVAIDLMLEQGYDLSGLYDDCGCMIYDIEKQDVHAGGSGCGCVSITFCGYIINLMREQKLSRVLVAGTGALLSPTSTLQGESIPGIAHAAVIEI
ncbi:MAG TPA: stage V sporulation protein AD [Firmicutes bacterium]|nr:stage V sporulation protein AD [Bacillota bacterium]